MNAVVIYFLNDISHIINHLYVSTILKASFFTPVAAIMANNILKMSCNDALLF